MSDDIKSALASALRTDGPPSIVDVDAVERAGARAARRRMLGIAGGATAAVAAVTAGALAAVTVLGGGAAVPDAPADTAGPDTAPVLDFPDLDPDVDYQWWYLPGSLADDDTAVVVENALIAYFDENHPEWRGVGYDDDGPVLTDPAEAGTLGMARVQAMLAPAPEPGAEYVTTPGPEDAVLTAPIYDLAIPAMEPIGYLEGTEIAVDGTGDAFDMIDVTLFPANSWLPGYDDIEGTRMPYNGRLASGCDEYEVTDAHAGTSDDRVFTFECDTVTVDGLTVERVTETETYVASGESFSRHTVVVHQPTGTAVRLAVQARPGLGFTQGSGDVPGTPTIDLDELTAIATAVPTIDITVD